MYINVDRVKLFRLSTNWAGSIPFICYLGIIIKLFNENLDHVLFYMDMDLVVYSGWIILSGPGQYPFIAIWVLTIKEWPIGFISFVVHRN